MDKKKTQMEKNIILILISFFTLINDGTFGQERECRDPPNSELDKLFKKNIAEHAYLLVNDIALNETLQGIYNHVIFPSNHSKSSSKQDCPHFIKDSTYGILCPHIFETRIREVIIIKF